MFDANDKQRISNFIIKINEVELKDKNINFEYDLTDYDNKRLIGTTYDCPRGNSTSEKWTDRMLSDTFTLVDIITYKLHHKNSLIGHLMFQKYESKKLIGEDISTLNINNSIQDFYSADEYYPGIGVKIDSRKQIDEFFEIKREHLGSIILKKI